MWPISQAVFFGAPRRFLKTPGVTSVISGYIQGAESIQVTFAPSKTNYRKLLILFWEAHDPTQSIARGPT